MKTLILFVYLTSWARFSYTLSSDEAKVLMKAAAVECRTKTAATDDDVNSLRTLNVPETSTGKCFVACTLQTLGMISSPQNTVNKPGFMLGIALMFPNDPEKAKLAEEVVDSCATITDTDECEAAHKIAKCLHAAKEDRGLTISLA